ncbi:MAG: hypothetical protein ABSE97_04360 [Verrucomicrobiota bacterium]|jgi:hypothetical protein
MLALLALLAYGIGVNEFTYAVREQDHHTIPAIAEIFKAVYPYFWILPILACITGISLVFKKEIRTVLVAWYVAVFAIAGTFLLCLTILIHYLLSTEFRLCG